MIKGLRTAIYAVSDIAKGKAFYSAILGKPPYFDEPFYVGFSVGGFELGLIPEGEPSADGVHVFWGVPDAEVEMKRLMTLGATVHSPVKDVGGGIKLASVLDPFGNVFGIIENSEFNPANVE